MSPSHLKLSNSKSKPTNCQGAPALLEAKQGAMPLFSVATLDFSVLPFTTRAPVMRTWPGPS